MSETFSKSIESPKRAAEQFEEQYKVIENALLDTIQLVRIDPNILTKLVSEQTIELESLSKELDDLGPYVNDIESSERQGELQGMHRKAFLKLEIGKLLKNNFA